MFENFTPEQLFVENALQKLIEKVFELSTYSISKFSMFEQESRQRTKNIIGEIEHAIALPDHSKYHSDLE